MTTSSTTRDKVKLLYNTHMVTIEVGAIKEHFFVHQSLLCAKSQYFNKALSGSFKEATTRFVQLPDVSLILFRIFVAWIYHDKLIYVPPEKTTIEKDLDSLRITEKDLEQKPMLQSEFQNKPNNKNSDTEESDDDATESISAVMPNHVGHERSFTPESDRTAYSDKAFEYEEEDPTTWPRHVFIMLYIFADRLDIRKLSADSMDALIGVNAECHKVWGSTIVRYIYANTPPTSKLRRYVVHNTAYNHIFYVDVSAWDNHPFEFVTAVMVTIGRRLPFKSCGKCHKIAPYDRDLCFYHEHPNDEERKACRLRRGRSKSAT